MSLARLPVASGPELFPASLAGTGLLVPALQPEPFPVRAIPPAPCTQACPAGINVKAYVSLIAERRFAEALEVVRRRCPLPGICGRICHHPCEAACKRSASDEPIAIRALKRFVADRERALPKPPPPPRPIHASTVAIVGSGPAGLTAAYDLRLAGFPVTVFEAEAEPGGMLRYGITAYRLPREVLDAEVDYLLRSGIEIRTGQRIGVDLELEQLLSRGYAAALLAVGAQHGRRLGLPGEADTPEVEDALAFLRRVNAGDRTRVSGRVLVLGGGSTAVEAARSALRLGADSVEIVYRRYREELLAAGEEIEAAEAEGIRFRFLTAPSAVVREAGRLTGLECVQVGLGEPDASGRRRPIRIPGSEVVLPAERVLAAVGQEIDLGFLPAEYQPRLAERGRLTIDPESTMTRLQGVFAAGDAVSGPSTVIDAIAAGHRAAEAIRHFLEEGRAEVREQRPERHAAPEYGLPDAPPLEDSRRRASLRRVREGREFAEVEAPLSPKDAVAEARRCLRCGPCGECRICAPSCGRRHVMMRLESRGSRHTSPTALLRVPGGVALALDARRPTAGRLLARARARRLDEIDPAEGVGIELLPVRARIHDERCRGCALCSEVCPFEAVRVSAGQGDDAGDLARIEAALCRGCNLCTAVCPTSAAEPSALSPVWWGERLGDAFLPEEPGGEPARPFVVLACQRRAGALESALDRRGLHIEVIRFRCVGQVESGMLLELYRHAARGVLVAGCLSGRCRFREGAKLAARQVERAQTMLRRLGLDAERIRADWSGDRAADPLAGPVARWVAGELARQPRPRAAAGGSA